MYARNLRQGFSCFSADGIRIGTVREVADTYFQCRTSAEGLPPDLYIPFSAIDRVVDNRICLNVPASELFGMHWQQPPSEGRMR